MMQKLGPALIGAALGMLFFWGMTKFLGEQAPHSGELPQASIAMPPLTPLEGPVDVTLTAGIRGAETNDEVVGTMVDRPPSAPAVGDAAPPQAAACFDHEVVPRLVVAPDYPYSARVSGQRGEVAVELTVGTDGAVSDAVVLSSEPPQVFDQAALEAVRQWRFDPRTQACAPVAARVRQVLQFRLDAGGG